MEVPEDLSQALETSPKARDFFEKLSYSHRKYYVEWIEEAKGADTRARRVAKAVVMLAEGKHQR